MLLPRLLQTALPLLVQADFTELLLKTEGGGAFFAADDSSLRVTLGAVDGSPIFQLNSSAAAVGGAMFASADSGFGTTTPKHYAGYTTVAISGTTGGNIEFEDTHNATVRVGAVYANSDMMVVESANPLHFYETGAQTLTLTGGNAGLGTTTPPSYGGYASLGIAGITGGNIEFTDLDAADAAAARVGAVYANHDRMVVESNR